jgi:4a-hydroxytetrahydrobiopterin dehydratase
VAIIAEAERHHPDIKIENYNQVILVMATHAINGLSENDFIMAAKIDVIA